MISTPEQLLASALNYAAHNCFVFPIEPLTKKPLIKWGKDSGNTTIDEAVIRRYWRRWPTASIGIACGPSNIIVVDLDGKEGIDEFFVLSKDKNLPNTPVLITGGGGQHIIFRQPPGILIKQSIKVLAPHIDIKPDKTLVVGAASNHKSGNTYRWVDGLSLDDLEPALPPQWLIDLMVNASTHPKCPERYSIQAREILDKAIKQIQGATEGERNNRLNQASFRVGQIAHLLGEAHCRERLFWAATSKDQPVPSTEAEATINSGLSAGTRSPLFVWQNWHAKLSFTSDGQTAKICEANIITALIEHSATKDLLSWDTRNYRINLTQAPPWDLSGNFQRAWDPDLDLLGCLTWLNNLRPAITCSIFQLERIILSIAKSNHTFDPWLEYLEGLKWDGVPRLNTLMTDLGATSPLANLFFRKWLISAVARTFVPGCQADHMLVLQGPQGVGKSSILRALVTDPGYHVTLRSRAGDKDALMQLIRPVIVEDSELSSYSKSEIEAVKDFLTEVNDTFRPPYGRDVISYPRRCVLCATTNTVQFISDDTGGRRFWPVVFEENIEIQKIIDNRDQIWGEAVKAYLSGEQWYFTKEEEKRNYLENKTINEQILEIQENHAQERDNLEYVLSDNLEQIYIPGIFGLSENQLKEGKILYISNLQACQIIAKIDLSIDILDPRIQKRVTHSLLHLGWKKARPRALEQKWYFFRPSVQA